MYQAAVGLLGSIGITLIYFYILNLPKKFKEVTGRKMVKPFSCSFCMSFWICLSYLLWNTTVIEAIFIGSTTPFIYLLIEDYLTNKFQL
jgi:drug/metabolite transporter (DMT)-like permease